MYLIVLSLGFMILSKKTFLLKPLKLCELSTWSSRINSRRTRQPTGLTAILHNNWMFRLLCKIVVRPVGRLVGLELMRDKISLSFYSFSVVVEGRENQDLPLDGGGNTLPNGYISCFEYMLPWVWLEIITRKKKLTITRGKSYTSYTTLKVQS